MVGAVSDLPLPIRTERLLLRAFVIDDVDDAHAYQQLPEVSRYLYREPLDRERTRELVGKASELTFAGEGDVLALAVQTIDSMRVIGEIVLKWTSAAARQAEVGYVFHPSAGGRGYATEATRAVMDLGFRHLNFHRIFARLDEQNTASAAVCRRLGMRQEARLVENDVTAGRWGTELVFAVLENEWSSA